jgi:integrase
MATIKFFIRATKSNPAHILVRFRNGRQFDYTAKIQQQINPKFWNNTKGRYREVAEFTDYKKYQDILDELYSEILNQFNKTDSGTITKDWLDKTIDQFHNPEKYKQVSTLFEFIQEFINRSKNRINPNTGEVVCYKMRREYQVTFNYLKEYSKKYSEPDFIDIDIDFYNQFVSFLRNHTLDSDGNLLDKGLQTNTIGKKIQTLKIFLNDATDRGINHYQKYKSRNFKTLTEETESFALTKEELTKLYEHDFSENERLEKVRDLFIVGCWTGLRFGDLVNISPDNIENGFFIRKQSKTKERIVIPLHYSVLEILDKYNGKLPKPISNQKFNEYLKEATKKAELEGTFIKSIQSNGLRIEKKIYKYEEIASHTARRTFCTIAYHENIPTFTIMAISGHKTEAAFLKYIKVSKEEHAKKLLQIWQDKGEFLKIAK